ncbi:MAG: cytochrome c [Caulobacteraceae bacterium]|jgi:cytochrome c553|nr:cytochrome c [Caulobacteraceae bacterium]
MTGSPRRILILLPLVLVAAAPPPDGKRIAEQGNGRGAAACSSCHGPTYQGNSGLKAPPIAGLSAGYIETRLKHYASPAGHNALMRQVATSLSPAEAQAVAIFLAKQPKGSRP